MKTLKAVKNLASAIIADVPVTVSIKEETKADLRRAVDTIKRIRIRKVKKDKAHAVNPS